MEDLTRVLKWASWQVLKAAVCTIVLSIAVFTFTVDMLTFNHFHLTERFSSWLGDSE